MPKPKEWSNVPQEIDEEMRTPTPREQELSKLAEKAGSVQPLRYDITSKNETAPRVVHDHNGVAFFIPPLGTRLGVLLRPDTAKYLARGDLTLTESAPPPEAPAAPPPETTTT